MFCSGCMHTDYCAFYGCALLQACLSVGDASEKSAPANGDTQPCRCAGAVSGAEGAVAPNVLNFVGAAA